ncbi:hypothetical protein BDZ94DRAFT_1246744 [Collybia nuda]|uniref:Uncharacterized protein n=1 Tax=Collybia nuda TaxID=64659 RepID=A0A9P5YIV5_9AGAR|nr:hypothetical protein BDZ94DRAFT_1246744 [Collybia nuda]
MRYRSEEHLTLRNHICLLIIIMDHSSGSFIGNPSPFDETFGAVKDLCTPTVATNMQGTLMNSIV